MNKDTKVENPLPFHLSFRDIIRIAFFVTAYFIAFQIAYLFPDSERILVAIWPASGIGLAALLLSQRRQWFLILAAFFLFGNISNLMISRPLFNSVGFMIANIIESYACAWFITRWCGENITFTKVKEILSLIFAATVVNAGTAFIGGGTAWIAGISPFWSFWKFWWIADGLGILIIAPLIVAWSTLKDISFRNQWKIGMEAGLFIFIWYQISGLSFQIHASTDPFAAKPYILVALLAYSALRLGLRGVTISLAVLMAVAITSEAITVGPSPLGGETMNDRLLMLQMYLSYIAVTGYLIAAIYSESRSSEQSSREDQSRIRALGDNLPNGMVYQMVCEHDGSMRFLYLSKGIEKLDGVSAEVGLRDPSTIYNLYLEEDRQMIARAEEISLRDMSTFNVVARMQRPDGQLRWMQLSASPRRLEDGRILWDGIQLDITEQKQAQEALQASEKKYRKLYEGMMDGFAYVSMDGTIRDFNGSFQNMLGYDAVELRNMTYGDITFKKWHAVEEKIIREQVLTRGYSDIYEKEYRKKDGTIFPIEIRTFLIKNEKGENEGMWAVVRDISERKHAEEEERLNSEIFKNVSEGIYVIGMEDGLIKHTNSKFEQMFGYEPGDMIGKDVSIVNAPTDKTPEETKLDIMDILKRTGEWNGEIRNIRKDGTPFWSYANVSLFDHPAYGRVIVGVHTDITERKQAQEELQIALIKYKTLFHTFPLGITVADRTGKIVESNPMAEKLLGISQEEHSRRKIDGQEWTIVRPDGTPLPAQEYASVRALRENRVVENMEMGIVKDHGEITWINVTAAPLPLEGHNLVITYNDITKRKKAEEKLIHAHNLMQYIISHAQSAIAVHDRNLKYVYVSAQYLKQYKVKEKDIIGKNHYEVFPDLPQKWRDVHQRALAGEISTKDEDSYVREDGSVDWTRWECRPWYESDGSIGGIIVYSEIITERKQREEALRASLEEKTVLLNEIHHRVKNNLQIVSSLLSLQAMRTKNKEAVETLRETGNRIRSMALLHETLYRSGSLTKLDFPGYIQNICAHIVRSYGPKAGNIKLDHHLAEITIDLDHAVPCGLIINELVSNALKHAFPEGRKGRITVELQALPDDWIMLAVADDGIGLPSGLDISTSETLGLKLVSMLVEKLKGTIEIIRDAGTAFHITFNIKTEKERLS